MATYDLIKSKKFKMTLTIACALGLFIDGFNMYISAATEPFIVKQFHASAYSIGLVQSAALIGAAIGAIIIGRMVDKLGRKTMFFLNVIFFIVAAILSGFSWNITSLIIFRFLVGFGVGANYPIIAVYISEMTSNVSRGKQVAWVMFINCLSSPVGVGIAYIIFVIYPSINAWRWMFGFGAIPAVILIIIQTKLPESYMWKSEQKNKNKKVKKIKKKYGFKEIFSKRFIRITLILAFVWFLMDISYYGVGLFTPEILQAMKFSTSANFITSTTQVVKITVFINSFIALGAFISIFLIDKIKRIQLQKLGFIISFFALLMLGITNIFFHGKVNLLVVFICFAVFNIALNAGPGITTYLLPSELYPTEIRGTGNGFAAGIAKMGAFLGVFILPVLQMTFGISITVILLSATLLIAYFLTFFIKTETFNIDISKVK